MRHAASSDAQRPTRLAVLAGVVLGASIVVAVSDSVPSWELRVTEWLNGLGDVAAAVLEPVMVLGTLTAVALATLGVLVARRDWRLAAATATAGVTAWALAKLVKRMIGRDRPGALLDDIVVRDSHATGFGFVSGHSTVAAALAVCVSAALPPRYRPIPIVLAIVVGIARIVHGVHLPVDVVGGWALGALIGFAVVWTASPSRRG